MEPLYKYLGTRDMTLLQCIDFLYDNILFVITGVSFLWGSTVLCEGSGRRRRRGAGEISQGAQRRGCIGQGGRGRGREGWKRWWRMPKSLSIFCFVQGICACITFSFFNQIAFIVHKVSTFPFFFKSCKKLNLHLFSPKTLDVVFLTVGKWHQSLFFCHLELAFPITTWHIAVCLS